MAHRLITAFALLVLPAGALAQEDGNGVTFRFGLGPGVGPGYFGDEDADARPAFKFRLEDLRLGGITAGGAENYGLGFGGSVRFVSAREAADYEELAGLDELRRLASRRIEVEAARRWIEILQFGPI